MAIMNSVWMAARTRGNDTVWHWAMALLPCCHDDEIRYYAWVDQVIDLKCLQCRQPWWCMMRFTI